ncbi:MAG TPA: universal stress protein [Vicinamibacterales bacterium]|jgi:nucleotide-binding universal stress UspA family protein|nr:universal stress protein [Vicinamibacterales bacterium]
MIEMRRILCPVDFSEVSRRALDHAVAIARWYESSIAVFHVCAPVPVTAYATVASMMPPTLASGDNRKDVLAAMKDFVKADASVPIDFEIGEGNAAREIIVQANASRSDLIVMGTHGRSGFERFVLGSVTERVLRHAGCPVLTVPPRAVDAVPFTPVIFKRIVCAIDFSDCSMSALDYAMSIAQEANAQLTVLHVVEPFPHLRGDESEAALGRAELVRELAAAAEEEARARLERAIPEGVREFCQVETVQTVGKASHEILKVAATQASDLIVIGVHGRSAADILFFGSTTQAVVRQATCPVLTLRVG